MKTTTKLILASIALAAVAVGCSDPKAEERAQSDRIRKEAKERDDSIQCAMQGKNCPPGKQVKQEETKR